MTYRRTSDQIRHQIKNVEEVIDSLKKELELALKEEAEQTPADRLNEILGAMEEERAAIMRKVVILDAQIKKLANGEQRKET
jgi:transposase-like protein